MDPWEEVRAEETTGASEAWESSADVSEDYESEEERPVNELTD
jgi:hypothetical protein